MAVFTSANVFLRSMLGPSAGRLRRFITRADVREYELLNARYAGFPRFREVGMRIGDYDIAGPDAASLLSSWKEIFLEGVYDWPDAPRAPRILDLGANIGLSVLHHKRLWPDAQVTAYEADPAIFKYLSRNLKVNDVDGVTLVNKAAWDRDETLRFWSEGADGGRIDPMMEERAGTATMLDAVDIARATAGQEFDFIKIDIEGAEMRVLPHIRRLLDKARAVFVEFHARQDEPHRLSAVLAELENSGFRVYIKPLYNNPRPFDGPILSCGFDQQLNLFAIR
jgi:FkbM family methyltransferase